MSRSSQEHDHQIDLAEVRRGLELLIDPSGLTQLTAITDSRTYSRTVRGLDATVKAVEDLSHHRAIYLRVNPLRRQPTGAAGAATDEDIAYRRWLYVDVDAIRKGSPNGQSCASVAEKADALAVAEGIIEHLRDHGLPEPVLADSGNGHNLFLRIDLPNDEDSRDLVKAVLLHLREQFPGGAKIDVSVSNAARLARVPGTWNRKGDNTKERPHRMARILHVPDRIEVCPRELLASLVGEVEPQPRTPGMRVGQSPHSVFRAVPTNRARAYTLAALRDEAQQVAEAISGEQGGEGRNNRLNIAAFRVAQLLHYGGVTENEVQAALIQASETCGLVDDDGLSSVQATITSGLRGGAKYPRPIPDQQDATGEVAVFEAVDDPHRLARRYITYPEGLPDCPSPRHWRGEYYAWAGGCYQKIEDGSIRAALTATTKTVFDEDFRRRRLQAADGEIIKPARKVTTQCVGNVLGALASLGHLKADVESPSWIAGNCRWEPKDILVCPNAIVHLPSFVAGQSVATIAPTPSLWSTSTMGAMFDQHAPEPREWLGFLRQLWGEESDQDSIQALQELFGYMLTDDTSHQKIGLIIGPTRSGKGTILRVMTALVGAAATASPTLASLGGEFGLQALVNKRLALISDARLSGRTDVAQVVERLLAISGEDGCTINRKFLPPISVPRLPVKFLIVSNELPRLKDASAALIGRLIVLRQTKSWYGKEDRTLLNRLLPELPGILLWAIAGWKRLRDRGHFVQPRSALKMVQQLRDLASPVAAFVRERCVVASQSRCEVGKLFRAWKAHCEDRGETPGTEQMFGRNLRCVIPDLDIAQPRVGGSRIRLFVGVNLREAPIADQECGDNVDESQDEVVIC